MAEKLARKAVIFSSKMVSSALADLGFEVVISPMFQTPTEAAQMAIDNNADIIGISTLAAADKILMAIKW